MAPLPCQQTRGRPAGVVLLGSLIREQRERLGLTRTSFASMCGLTARTLQEAENSRSVSQQTARQISRCLGLPLSMLARPSVEQARQSLRAGGLAPPPPPVPWASRPRHTESLGELLRAPGLARACIAGPSGIGKTALARHVCCLLEESFPDGIAWVHGPRLVSPRMACAVQTDIARALGFAAQLPSLQLVDPASFFEAFQQRFWEGERLLVVDEAPSFEVVRRFVPLAGKAAALVTSHVRRVADHFGEACIELEGLDRDQARALLCAYVDEERLEADPEGAARLLEVLGGVPRSLYIAGRVLESERSTSPGDYAQRIAEDPSAHSVRDEYLELEAWETRDSSQVASYAILEAHLSPGARQLLSELAPFETRPFNVSWAAATSGLNDVDAGLRLAELVDYFIVQELRPADAEDVSDLGLQLDSHAAWYVRWLCGDRYRELRDRLQRSLPTLAHRLRGTEPMARRAAFTALREQWGASIDALSKAIMPVDFPRRAVAHGEVPQPKLASAQREQQLAFARTVEALGEVLLELQASELERWVPQAYAVARALGEEGLAGELAWIAAYWAIEQKEEWAAEWFRAAHYHFIAVEAYVDAAAAAEIEGGVHAALGQPQEAVARSEAAYTLARRQGLEGSPAACFCNTFGVLLTRSPLGAGGWAQALKLFQEGLALCCDDGGVDRRVRAVLRSNHSLASWLLAGREGGRETLQECATEMLEVFDEADLTRVHALLLAASGGDRDAVARAKEVWTDCITQCDPLDLQRLVHLIGEAALFLFMRNQGNGNLPPVVAEDTGFDDVAMYRDFGLARRQALVLLYPLSGLEQVLDADQAEAALSLVERSHGRNHLTYRHLEQLLPILRGAST